MKVGVGLVQRRRAEEGRGAARPRARAAPACSPVVTLHCIRNRTVSLHSTESVFLNTDACSSGGFAASVSAGTGLGLQFRTRHTLF